MGKKVIPVARPLLGVEEAEAAGKTILSGWITQGPQVAAFENEFAEFVGAPHACAVANCTVALHLALIALGIGPGDEVITVSHSYIATANAIVHSGAEPVFVDIRATDFNIDATKIEAAISAKTKAILCVHQLGMPCDIVAISKIAKRNNLRVIEDAACAAGSEFDRGPQSNLTNHKIGRPIGDVVCFSFHPRKVLTTGDGGMITTHDPDLDHHFRLLRQHGMGVSDVVRHMSDQVVFEKYDAVGYNYRMTDIQAAIGRVQLGKLPQMISERRDLAERYKNILGHLDGISLPAEARGIRSNWQSFCILLDEKINQRQFMQFLLDKNISTRRGVMCTHRETAYSGIGRICGPIATSERCQDSGVILPLYNGMSEKEQRHVTRNIIDFISQIQN